MEYSFLWNFGQESLQELDLQDTWSCTHCSTLCTLSLPMLYFSVYLQINCPYKSTSSLHQTEECSLCTLGIWWFVKLSLHSIEILLAIQFSQLHQSVRPKKRFEPIFSCILMAFRRDGETTAIPSLVEPVSWSQSRGARLSHEKRERVWWHSHIELVLRCQQVSR